MTAAKNAPPKHVYEALRRLRTSTKQDLAAALGVSRHTLNRWEQSAELDEPASRNAQNATSRLLRETLKAANCLDLLDA